MLRLLVLPVLALLVGCGGSDTPDTVTADDEPCGCECGCGCGCGDEESSGGQYTPAKGTATVKGTATFEGKAPRRRPIDMGSVKYCTGAHAEDVLSQTAIVGSNGELAYVFVSVKKGLRGWKFPKPTGQKVLDQSGCMYVPHMMGLQIGEKLLARNSDPIMHNVHGYSMKTGREVFNFSQTKKGSESSPTLDRAGMVHVKCDVHGWMGAYIGVVKHPFYAVTGEDGAFSLAKLPPGEYTIEAWHEKYVAQSQTVTVGDGETKEIAFVFSKKKKKP